MLERAFRQRVDAASGVAARGRRDHHVDRWRDKTRSGSKIDASGKLFGEVKFTTIVGFKDAILSRPEKFMRAFSEHLLSFALDRGYDAHHARCDSHPGGHRGGQQAGRRSAAADRL
ncbi:MAG: DUF1585 domain-containing protein [Planctomycetes bacterium]|nr:DUF1585 domain-containing protein [Planctomycetota bacterium]